MEKPPSVVSVEDKEKEINPEKRSRMWETLRIAALSGLLSFSGYQAVENIYLNQELNQARDQLEDIIKDQNLKENERLQKEDKEKQSLTVKDVEAKASYVMDGKLISEAKITTMDGKQYETRAETDLTGEYRSITESAGGIDWNRAFVSSIHEDGSGLKVIYKVTEDGLKMTIQDIGPGGRVLNERVSLIEQK